MLKVLGGTLFLSIFAVATVQGAEFEVHPSLAVSGEFTDNIFESNTTSTSDYITRMLPGVFMSYKAPALTGNLDYVFDYRHYVKDTHKDEISHALNAKGHLTAAENLLFLDVSEEFQRVSLDMTRDNTPESLFVNQTDRNIATVSPYFTVRPTARIYLKPGYRFIDTRYFSSAGIDKADHIAFVDLAYELNKKWSVTASYTFTRELVDSDSFSQHQVLGGFRYEYDDKSFAFAQAGNSWTLYDSSQSLESFVWDAGITHTLDTATVTVTTGVKYNEDPLRNNIKESFVSGIVTKNFQRGVLSLSPYYSEYVLTQSDVLQAEKSGVTVRGQHEFTSDLKGRLAFTAEKYEQPALGSYTRRLLVESGLGYLLAERLTVSLSYTYVNYYSPVIVADNLHVNRAMIELKKIF